MLLWKTLCQQQDVEKSVENVKNHKNITWRNDFRSRFSFQNRLLRLPQPGIFTQAETHVPIYEMKGKNGPEMTQKCEKARDTTK